MTGTLADGWPEHLLDLAAWDAHPEDTRGRFELVEGVPQVSPRASLRHQRIVSGFLLAFEEALPRERTALTDVEVVIAADPWPQPVRGLGRRRRRRGRLARIGPDRPGHQARGLRGGRYRALPDRRAGTTGHPQYQLVQGRRYERVAHHEEPAMVRLGLGPLVDLAAPIPR